MAIFILYQYSCKYKLVVVIVHVTAFSVACHNSNCRLQNKSNVEEHRCAKIQLSLKLEKREKERRVNILEKFQGVQQLRHYSAYSLYNLKRNLRRNIVS